MKILVLNAKFDKLYNDETILDRLIRLTNEIGFNDYIVMDTSIPMNRLNNLYNCNFTLCDKNNLIDYLDDDLLILDCSYVFNKRLLYKLYNVKGDNAYLDHDYPFYKLGIDAVIRLKEIYSFNLKEDLKVIFKEFKFDVIDTSHDYIKDDTDYLEDVKYFDYKEQEIFKCDNYLDNLKNIIKDEKTFIVCSSRLMEEVSSLSNVYVYTNFSANPKYEEIKEGIDLFNKYDFKNIVAIGGGSAIDTAKCIKLFFSNNNELDFLDNEFHFNNINLIAIPTTAGTGSESTHVAVFYYNNEKRSVYHESILPNKVILDYNLLFSLPLYQKKSTMLDALCQSIESIWSNGSNSFSKVAASRSILGVLNSYKGYLEGNIEDAKEMLIAANQSGKSINISKTTLPHTMSYKLASLYGISHGHAVALSLIPVWKKLYNESLSNKDLYQKLLDLASLMDCSSILDSIKLVEDLINSMNFDKIDIHEFELDILADSINLSKLGNNPIKFTREDIYNLYKEMM